MTDLSIALDKCLERLSSGESVEAVLADQPEFAGELRLLLSAAVSIDREVPPPSDIWRAQARSRLLATARGRTRPRRLWRPSVRRRVTVGLATVVFSVLSLGTAAAQTALPGQVLYRWKIASEETWRAVQADPLEVDLVLLDRRTNEWIRVRGLETEVIARVQFQRLITRLAGYDDPGQRERIRAAFSAAASRLIEAGVRQETILPTDLNFPDPLPDLEITPLPLLPELVPTIDIGF
jgi:hypothetical protein